MTGTSVRKVEDLVKALGADTGISKSFADRNLSECSIPYVFLDAT